MDSFETALSQLPRTLKQHARHFAHDDWEDLIQRTIIRCLEYRHNFNPESNFQGWAYTIMRNLYLSEKRRSWRMYFTNKLITDPQPDNAPALTQIRELTSALATLTPDQRECLIAVALGDKYPEIAKRMGCATGTVKSRASRARQQVMEILGEARD